MEKHFTQVITNKKRILAKPGYVFVSYVFCLFSAIMYSVTESAILAAATVTFICIMAFFWKTEDYFVFIAGLQFVRVAIPLYLGASRFVFILFVYIVLVVKLLWERKSIYYEQMLLMLLLLLDISTSTLSHIFKIGDNINWFFSFAYIAYMVKKYFNVINLEKLVIYFLLAQWAICVINILAEFRILGQSLVPSMYGTFNKLGAFAFGKAYPQIAGGNGISFNNAMAISLCILLWPYIKKRTVKLFFAVSILLLGYCGIMVISRGFYIEIAIFLILLLISNISKPKHLMMYILIIAIIVLVVYRFAYDKLLINFSRVFERFEGGNQDREMLIFNAKELLKNNLSVTLFGAGTYYPEIYGFTAHNLYLDSIVSLGVIGGFIFWMIVAELVIYTLKKYVRFSIKAVIPIIMLFVFKTVSGSTRDIGFYYYLALTLLCAYYISPKRCINK